MRKDTGRAFFEVFRRPDDAEKPKSWWAKRSATRSGKREQAPRPVESGVRARDVASPRGRLTLALSREVSVILMFAIVVVLVASHVWGYRRGLAKRDVAGGQVAVGTGTRPADGSADRRIASARSAPTDDQARALSLDVAARRDLELPFHTLRIISGIKLESAKRIRAELLAKGYDAFIYQDPRYSGYTVNVGRYTTNSAPELGQLKLRFMTVYRDCYATPLDARGRIIP